MSGHPHNHIRHSRVLYRTSLHLSTPRTLSLSLHSTTPVSLYRCVYRYHCPILPAVCAFEPDDAKLLYVATLCICNQHPSNLYNYESAFMWRYATPGQVRHAPQPTLSHTHTHTHQSRPPEASYPPPPYLCRFDMFILQQFRLRHTETKRR